MNTRKGMVEQLLEMYEEYEVKIFLKVRAFECRYIEGDEEKGKSYAAEYVKLLEIENDMK